MSVGTQNPLTQNQHIKEFEISQYPTVEVQQNKEVKSSGRSYTFFDGCCDCCMCCMPVINAWSNMTQTAVLHNAGQNMQGSHDGSTRAFGTFLEATNNNLPCGSICCPGAEDRLDNGIIHANVEMIDGCARAFTCITSTVSHAGRCLEPFSECAHHVVRTASCIAHNAQPVIECLGNVFECLGQLA